MTRSIFVITSFNNARSCRLREADIGVLVEKSKTCIVLVRHHATCLCGLDLDANKKRLRSTSGEENVAR